MNGNETTAEPTVEKIEPTPSAGERAAEALGDIAHAAAEADNLADLKCAVVALVGAIQDLLRGRFET